LMDIVSKIYIYIYIYIFHFLIVLVAYRDLINAVRMDGSEFFFKKKQIIYIYIYFHFLIVLAATNVAANS
jgi:hypothetical protein